jgi:hypothetical protein
MPTTEICSRTNVTPSTRIPQTLGCCKSSSNSFRFARLPQTPSSIHYLLFLKALSSKIAIYPCSMWQTGQRPAKDPYISIPRRLPHGPKTLGEIQRPTPRPSVYGVWGSRTGEDAVVDGLVESCGLGGRRSGGAKLGVGGSGGICCVFTCLGESGFVDTG